jgi:uncharacterized repeat protein (TIGR03803 family)
MTVGTKVVIGSAYRVSSVITNSSLDLFATSGDDGAYGDGSVVELVHTASGYASKPITIASFDGESPFSGLTMDSKGDLFGTADNGSSDSYGIVFEIVKTATGYNSTPVTVATFNGTDGEYPYTTLTIDANGDLFGTTEVGGASGHGTVFEVVNTGTGYASTPTALASFGSSADTFNPQNTANLTIDSKGNLIGTADSGGTSGDGRVYEIAKTATGYASSITTLVTFDGANGKSPYGAMVADSQGNLYGTTDAGGAHGDGTLYEIAKTATGYASTATILINFDGADGANPQGGLTIDADGNLFGTTSTGGSTNKGTLFELAKTTSGYASAVTTLLTFGNGGAIGQRGLHPGGSLLANSKGNLFVMDYVEGYSEPKILEIMGSGFATGAAAATADIVSPLAGGSNTTAMTFLAPASTDQSQTTAPANGWNFFAELQTSQLLAPASLTSTETSTGLTDDHPATGFSASLNLSDTSASHLAGISSFKDWLHS